MQRINTKVTDKARLEKRRNTFRKKKFRKSFINRKLKPVYDINELNKYDINDPQKPRAPFYDPYQAHVHVWRSGIIPCEQDPCSKYFNPVKIGQSPVKGRYCIVCHIVSKPFVMSSSVDNLNKSTLNLRDAVDMFLDDNKEEEIVQNFKNLNIKEQRRFEVIRGEGLEEDLFIPNFACKFYAEKNPKCMDGKVIRLVKGNKLIVEDIMGEIFEVKECKTVMNYDGYITGNVNHKSILNGKKKNYPVWYPPVSVSSGVVYEYNGKKFTQKDIWCQKWTNFMKWKSMIEFLCQYLPQKCGYKINPPNFTNYIPHEHESLSKFRMKRTREVNKNDYCFLVPNNSVKVQQPNVYYKIIKADEKLVQEMHKLSINPVKKRKVVTVF